MLVLGLKFESFFFDLLASVGSGNKMDAKFSTKTKTLPVQNLFRYISFLFAKTCICKIKKDLWSEKKF